MTAVVYVHGMWMPGGEMTYMRRYLKKHHGFEGFQFRYPSVRGTLDENAASLAEFVRQHGATAPVHLVGHSLGGVVILRMLLLHPQAPAARVVCMGSPLCGSRAAAGLSRRGWGKAILGRSIAEGVTGDPASNWVGVVTERHEVGIIAGTVAAGLGRLVTAFDGKSDGTVAVAETQLAGARDHVSVATSHSGLVLSKKVAEQVAAFLQRGKFDRP